MLKVQTYIFFTKGFISYRVGCPNYRTHLLVQYISVTLTDCEQHVYNGFSNWNFSFSIRIWKCIKKTNKKIYSNQILQIQSTPTYIISSWICLIMKDKCIVNVSLCLQQMHAESCISSLHAPQYKLLHRVIQQIIVLTLLLFLIELKVSIIRAMFCVAH